MQNEIGTAVRLTTSLSRNAGASSAAILAQIRSNIYTIGVINQMRIGILYAVAYLYEHREEADHHELTLTLRSLLFGIRKAAF